MPREDRRIIFSYDEAYKAVYSLCVQKEIKKPPPGHIDAIDVDPDDKNKLVLSINNSHENTEHTLTYSRDFLAAALMLFCRSQGIPISKKATKSVELKPDSLILRLVI
ncbi:MAG: hypothetical protein H6869_08380 [Rhodospirillales bacterium]|nr:hypothetical protein [Rhodospirillales bacterium]